MYKSHCKRFLHSKSNCHRGGKFLEKSTASLSMIFHDFNTLLRVHQKFAEKLIWRTFSIDNEVVDDDLSSIEEISKLCFPQHQMVGILNTYTVFVRQYWFFYKRTVRYLFVF